MEENADKLKLQFLAGGSLIEFPPILSSDASLLFTIEDKCIRIYSTSTGEVIRVLQGANDPLISFEFDPKNQDIMMACTKKGELIRWKWKSGIIKRRVQLQIKGDFLYHTFNLVNLNKKDCAIVTGVKPSKPVQMFMVNTVDGKFIQCPVELKLKRQKALVSVSTGCFQYFVIAQGRLLFLVNYKTWEWKKLKNDSNYAITCLKIHPKQEMIATGDENGVINLWRHFLDTRDNVIKTRYHWHHTAVSGIAFSASGTSLYSGGLESVLVKWNINDPENKHFVPRIVCPIRHIATCQDNANIAVSTADNAIQIMGVEYKTLCTIQNSTYIHGDPNKNNTISVGLKVNPRKNTLVLNGRTGHLQFYSVHTKTLLYNMDIVGQNIIYDDDKKIFYRTRVTQVALNINWMATAEVFNDEQTMPEVRLKFWQYSKTVQQYELAACIEYAHEGGIRAIEFSNSYYVDNLLCATVGFDNIIKIWALENSDNIYKLGKQGWNCVSQTHYKQLPIKSIAFSQDGSLLAAGFGNTLCVYKSENLKLLTCLVAAGNFDGYIHKAQIRVPKLNKNGSKNNSRSNKNEKIIELISSLLQGKDETLLKEIKQSVKPRRIRKIQTINDDSQKLVLYKKIKSLNQLNLFQKLLLYQRLGICFQISEEWHSKLVAYVKTNSADVNRIKLLKKQIPLLSKNTCFKAKYMFEKYMRRKQSYDENVVSKLAPLLKLLKKEVKDKAVLTNGVAGPSKEPIQDTIAPPSPLVSPLHYLLQIKKVLFCSGDFAHLVIACTENRVLIWNLLNLRLQTVLKLSVDQIAIDSENNLVSVFTKNRELYIFSPSDALTLYFRPNMPRVLGAVWMPRKNPKSQAFFVNWQSRSILYFLTDNNDIAYLGEDEDSPGDELTFKKEASSDVNYSIFGTFAKKQTDNRQSLQRKDNSQTLSIGVHGKAAVKSFLEMSSHTMAPLSLLCNDFLKSVIELNLPSEKKKSQESKEVMLNGHNDLSDDEIDYSAKRTLIDNIDIKTKSTDETNSITDEYLQKISAETIEIEF